MKQMFDIKGMTCSACSSAVNRAVSKIDAVSEVNVNLMTNSMSVTYDENVITDKDITKAVEDAGYFATVQGAKSEKKGESLEKDIWTEQLDSMKFRLTVSIPLTIILMYVAMGSMVGLPIPEFLTGQSGAVNFAFTQFLIALPIIFVNRAYYQKGFKTLMKKAPNMDSLIAIGSSSAIIYGIFAIYRMSYSIAVGDMQTLHKYHHNLYFESAVMILTLITLGKYFETKSKKKTNEAISSLINLRPSVAHLIKGDEIVDVEIDDVKIGDILQVKMGESIPVDGVVKSGNVIIDESAITGESLPVEKNAGDKIIGATINKGNAFSFEVTNVGADTLLSKIIELVKDANATKAPIESIADKISAIFVPVVISLAIITFVFWKSFGYDVEFALNFAISVLVISCPCALGLATPVAIMVGTGQGAKNGILFKNASALESMYMIDTVVFDKTGTLTQGTPVVTDVIINESFEKDEVITLISSLEQNSQQPIALAITDYGRKNLTLKNTDSFAEISGRGVKGKIGGKNLIAGNMKFMLENNVDTSFFEEYASSLQDMGKTVIFFAIDNVQSAIIAVADIEKNTSATAIKALKDMGIKTVMLTGDNKKAASYIANKIGVDEFISDVMPDQKDEEIIKIKGENKKVAMVGDGINDSPALARADVGIAVGTGTDIAIESADIVLMKSDLQDVVTTIKLSRATLINIKQNLFWAFFYNILCIPLAMGVFYLPFNLYLNPMIGSVAMSFSSVFVVSNALRLRKFKDDKKVNYVKQEINQDVNIEIVDISNHKQIKEQREEIKMVEKIMYVEGMSCAHCKARVEKVLNEISGVNAVVNLDEKLVNISLNSDVDNQVLSDVVTKAGYEVKGVKDAG
ncbi:copper-exporting ATPase [[Eubacterium] yurii subsp. margaretiae ATCC 43715]|nr:copper-exporting ATPase [[Eubacterium] yurii subsp. margaretiae ATCC 43715]